MGLIFGGILLDLFEFPRGARLREVAMETVWQLGVIAGLATSIFTFFGMALLMGYRIDRGRYEEIIPAPGERTQHESK